MNIHLHTLSLISLNNPIIISPRNRRMRKAIGLVGIVDNINSGFHVIISGYIRESATMQRFDIGDLIGLNNEIHTDLDPNNIIAVQVLVENPFLKKGEEKKLHAIQETR